MCVEFVELSFAGGLNPGQVVYPKVSCVKKNLWRQEEENNEEEEGDYENEAQAKADSQKEAKAHTDKSRGSEVYVQKPTTWTSLLV